MSVRLRVRPLQSWPETLTRHRVHAPFRSTYDNTRGLLEREVGHLGAREAVIQLALTESEIRVDGTYPLASASPAHPGVVVSFDSKHGPLRYSTDRFRSWQDNLRAIALALEALRKVDRYGVGSGGEQYRGWNALGSGTPMRAAMTYDEAQRLLGLDGGAYAVPDDVTAAVRRLSKLHHPDVGGDADLFRRLIEARDLLIGGES